MIGLYSIGKKYKFEMPERIFYTGEVITEDDISIKIISKFNEEIILNKTKIVQAQRIGVNSNERKLK